MAFAIGIIVLVVVVLVALVGGYNSLVSLRLQTDNALSQIDVQLKRRYDLIPNLVETVKGYMKHEQDTLEKVIQARNSALSARTVADRAHGEAQVSGALGNLLAISESYPELRSSENMLSLQEELKSTENRVAFARQFYNDTVTAYNTKLETIPTSVIASIGGFKPKEIYLIEDPVQREAVKVSFS